MANYSNRDKSIMTANPDSSPEQLLELGLSQKAFDRMTEKVAKEPIEVKTEKIKEVENVEEINIVEVTTQQIKSSKKKVGGQDVVTVTKISNGKTFTMSASAVGVLDPKEYQIN